MLGRIRNILPGVGQGNVTKPVGGPSAVQKGAQAGVGKRRVLGDITNAHDSAAVESKEGKKVHKASAASAASSSVVTMTTDEPDNRSYMSRLSDDIDARDADNPLLCATYVNDMYDIFMEIEKKFAVNPNYMSSQQYINERMRVILVDWLVDVHLKFKMVPETLYLTINIIDRYLENVQVRRSKLQLVGVAALLLAAKYEEIYPPDIRDLVHVTDKAYSDKEIVSMECDVILRLNHELTVPTIHSFLCRYLKAAHADRTMVQLSCFITERSLQEYSMVKYLPSVIAASAVYIARKTLKRHPWSPTLVKYTTYDEDDLTRCVEDMEVFFNETSTTQKAVHRKYSSVKFGEVAKMSLHF